MGLRISREVAARVLSAEDAVDSGRPLELRDLRLARELAARLAAEDAEIRISAGRLSATVELARILRRRLEDYFDAAPELLDRLLGALAERLGADRLRAALELFGSEFLAREEAVLPELAAAGEADLRPVLLEAILYWAVDSNPATAPVSRRLQDSSLRAREVWVGLLEELPRVLEQAPPLDQRSASLSASLRGMAEAAPDSLSGQLRFLVDEWPELAAMERAALAGSLDLIAEEEAPRFPPGPGPVELPDYGDFEDESARYSADTDWMETLVLIAKNIYVWLDQLSRDHGREISRLDQIPGNELDRLAERGVRGLWLIGIWERSAASARIKRLLGNPEALASAYSLDDYEIATSLGGRGAVEELAERAAERGIRLAADMVPNHMGIDSRWVVEHPERFLSVAECPFPAYSFDGPDLSADPRVGIYLEDHYYDRSDAAVVFKRVDHETGGERYIYHGNDGTSTPWNDTAQLDYLNPETRRAVIDTILRVAESFPVIRFDAAMTLARRHVQRLWFPEPGRGGAIPSRSEHALSREAFQRAMPKEFWREVVDRVAEERPDTLLLAEAFWLMEGFFVRTLGMHRVYNSAFMNLLRDGETDKLRRLIRETLDFDPQILKRYVNFLSNPDEATAIEQFGAGDRYFGACVAMATLPGLPMIAHGQFEGYREKYGMEFRRPRLAEEPDVALLARHRREIFPLLRMRVRFAGVDDFRLLDLVDEHGAVDGNVLAYANGREIDRSIVLFNNSPDPARGALPGIADWLEVEAPAVYRFRDRTSGLYFLAAAARLVEKGIEVELAPFESRVLVDFRPVLRTVQEPYDALAERLAGRGVRNVEVELDLLEWLPLIETLSACCAAVAQTAEGREAGLRRDLRRQAAALRRGLDGETLGAGLDRLLRSAGLEAGLDELEWPESGRMRSVRQRVLAGVRTSAAPLRALLAVATVHAAVREPIEPALMERILLELLQKLDPAGGEPAAEGLEATARVLALALEEGWLSPTPPPGPADLERMVGEWLGRADAGLLLGLNRYRGEAWVRKEELELALWWRGLTALCGWRLSRERHEETSVAAIAWIDSLELLRRRFESAGYAVGPVRAGLTGGAA